MKKILLLLPAFLVCFSACKEEEGPPPAYERFTGKWNVTDNCGGSEYEYELMIGASYGSEMELFLYNLNDLGYAIGATAIIGPDSFSFTFPEQELYGFTISGSGHLVEEVDSLYFQWSGGPRGSCSAGASYAVQ